MSRNNSSHDKSLSAIVDDLMRSKQASGVPLLDDLAGIKPQANSAFQQQLEDDLIARLYAQKKHDTHQHDTDAPVIRSGQPASDNERYSKTMNLNYPQKLKRQPQAIPLTLVAAVLALLVIGGMVIVFLNPTPPQPSYSAPAGGFNDGPSQGNNLPTVVPTSTPLPINPNVNHFQLTATQYVAQITQTAQIAQQAAFDHLQPTMPPPSVNPLLPTSTPIAIMPVVIAVQNIPRGLTITPDMLAVIMWPVDAAPFQALTNIDDVIGQIARTDIYREQPIMTNLLLSPDQMPNAALQPVVISLVDVERGDRLERENLAVVHWPVIPLAESGAPAPNIPDTPLQSVYTDTVQVSGPFAHEIDPLAGRIANRRIAKWQPITSSAVVNRLEELTSSLPLPPNTIAVSIPLAAQNVNVYPVHPGDTVDVMAVLLTIDIENGFTPAPDTMPQVQTQLIVREVPVVAVDNTTNTLTVAVSPQDAEVLQWMADEASIPLAVALWPPTSD